MELYELNPTTWDVIDIVEGYDSLIWTERYQPAGDFELKTGNVQDMMNRLPLMSAVGINESGEVALVENHSIEYDQKGQAVLTVSGRTYETFGENRSSSPTGNSDNAILILSPPPTIYDAIEAISTNQINALEGSVYTIYDELYPIQVLPAAAKQIPRGEAYANILKLLAENDLGIRNYRIDPLNFPELNFPGYQGMWKGTNIYKGIDRRTMVVFDVRAGHFTNPKYLFSVKGWKTSVYVAGKNGGLEVNATGYSGASGLNRRIDVIDASDITQAAGATLNAMLTSRGKSYLNEHKKTVMFEGTVGPDNPYTYGYHDGYPTAQGSPSSNPGADYYLGDKVKLVGDFGLDQDMIVTEYVRIKDKNGERAYPTLDTPDAI